MPDAILFDLDGTLLDMDVDEFMKPYMASLGEAVAEFVPAETFASALLAAVMAMIEDEDPRHTNEHVFWTRFSHQTGVALDQVEDVIDTFYKQVFPRLSSTADAVPAATDVVRHAAQKTDTVVLATNPIFPRVAVEARLQWAGLDPDAFTWITTYENMHACKPKPEYYRQICRQVGVRPEAAVMVGNDPHLDIAPAAAVGMATYLVDDVTPPGEAEAQFAATNLGSLRIPAADDRRHGQGPLAAVSPFLDRLFA